MAGVRARQPPTILNDSGATWGVPAPPKRVFFSVIYAGYRFRTAATNSGNLPSAAQITGNFAENLPTDITSCTQAPTATDNTNLKFLVCDPVTRKPYPSNKLPSVDPTSVNILNYITKAVKSEPQRPFRTGDTPYTYLVLESTPEQNEQYLINTDHQITSKHPLTLSYFLLDYSVRINLAGFTQLWSYSNYANK